MSNIKELRISDLQNVRGALATATESASELDGRTKTISTNNCEDGTCKSTETKTNEERSGSR